MGVMNDNDGGKNVTIIEEDVNTQVQDEHPFPVMSTAPSMENSDVTCKPDKLGLCRTHRCGGSITKVSSKKWKDRGGGRGYGYVHSTTKKFLCDSRKSFCRKTGMFASDRLRDNPADRQIDVVTGLGGIPGPGHVGEKN